MCLYILLLFFSHSVLSDSFNNTDCNPGSSLSMGFSRQEYWSGLPSPSPGDLPDPAIEPESPALQADSLPLIHRGRLYIIHIQMYNVIYIYISHIILFYVYMATNCSILAWGTPRTEEPSGLLSMGSQRGGHA